MTTMKPCLLYAVDLKRLLKTETESDESRKKAERFGERHYKLIIKARRVRPQLVDWITTTEQELLC